MNPIELLKTNLNKNNHDILTWMALADAYEDNNNPSAADLCRTIVGCLTWAKQNNRRPDHIYYNRSKLTTASEYAWRRHVNDTINPTVLSALPHSLYVCIPTYLGDWACHVYSTRNDAYRALFNAWIQYDRRLS